ncbi:MAG: hypothetical protein ACRDUV_21155 [Pseudonocardiaceae bacterium]
MRRRDALTAQTFANRLDSLASASKRDALNVLSRVERAAGDTEAAAQAARAAYLKAWCDGPPFSYAVGLDEARANLSAVGAPEPDGLDGFELSEPFPEVLIKPTPRAELT